jgi:hypothetical protein
LVLRELHRSERKLADRLDAMAARHRSDQDIFYLAHDLAGWSRKHLEEIADHSHRRGLRLPAGPRIPAITGALQSRLSGALRHRPEPGLLLLTDLRRIHLIAAGLSVDWELLGQVAQAVRDQDLLDLTSRCHPETLRQMRWANAMLKELSPQILTS